MRLSAKITAWLLPFVLTGCFHLHRTNQSKNQPVAPAVPPSTIKTEPVDLPPDITTIPPQPTETAKTPNQTAPKPPPPHHRSKAVASPPEVSASAPPPPPTPAVSAIGQLSSGDPSTYRRETEESILSTEKGLNGLNRSLNDLEQKTADHIREFLKQAREALGTGDVDGAHNLAAKAKVLLAELQK
jgi:outer membrane biosynthesis protein TonB